MELPFGFCGDLSPDGRRLLVVAAKQARLHDVATGDDLGVVFNSANSLSNGRMSADGRTLVLTGYTLPNEPFKVLSLFADEPEEARPAP